MTNRTSPRSLRLPRPLAGAALALLVAAAGPAHAERHWTWSYSGGGVSAAGTMTTADLADTDGWYEITSIAGQRNGEAITGLQPTGTAIPLNEPFKVDNLVKSDGTLSSHGLGFATDGGHYANLFVAGWSNPPGPYEFWTAPATGVTGEGPIAWRFASQVPEPASALLLLAGGAALAWRRRAAR